MLRGFCFNDPATTEIYTLSLHDALPIVEQADFDGNKLTYAYTGANLTQITTADGGTIRYTWSGANISEIVTGYIEDWKSTRLNSSHANISYAVFCLKK